ncbi:MAG: hypothetical protein KF708_16660 [Pirellulales bacterium]|nr:hypothetical protein [Pirellulales bacterium]
MNVWQRLRAKLNSTWSTGRRIGHAVQHFVGEGEDVKIEGPVGVIVSHYDARPIEPLVQLLDGLAETPAGFPYEVRVVINHETWRPCELPERHRHLTVVHRENRGFNIGAWEQGWRLDPPRDAYLFLQDECIVARENWLLPFVEKASQSDVGLVGERIPPTWDLSWSHLEWQFGKKILPGHEVSGRQVDRLTCYRDFWRRQGIPPAPTGAHVQSLVMFARREVLARIGGFPLGQNYGEAIAAEIGASFLVRALGLRLCEVGETAFTCFNHPQWLSRAAQHRDPAWLERTTQFRNRKLDQEVA